MCATRASSEDALLPPTEHVLSTLEQDGSRRWLRPRLSMGDLWRRRRIVAYVLMIVFVVLPHIRISGKPFILIDVAAREFTFLGWTFLPTDTLLLALLMLGVLISIVFVTAISGRAWCGWACPQTVYMEFLFRPIDRLFEGTAGKGGKPRSSLSAARQIGRLLVYLVLCTFLAHTFLAYFVPADQLARWVRSSPIEHPTAFLVMAATTGLMLFDFLVFREQMCLITCPYGRFQSVMLDEQSKIVAYDPVRGEPRKKGKHKPDENVGDCVDCNQCVVVCPTGIDIRNGLQMECINCTQCIDACNAVMEKVGSPRGLIRFSSQDSIAGKPKRLFRARTIVYPLILLAVFCAFVFVVSTKTSFDARVLRGKGAPFNLLPGKLATNSFSIRLVNRSGEPQVFSFEVIDPKGVTLEVIDEEMLNLNPGDSKLVPVSVRFPNQLTSGDGNELVTMQISDGANNQKNVTFRILGPR
ncbi:MAG: cytochrome c oxidase accessory protein CcoG [Pirellulaceae bacterium]|nr:cytochrome c oxidase accessory protein CcoG [Pirellulaceae bacterium]